MSIKILNTEMAPKKVARRVEALRIVLDINKSTFADQVGIDRSSYAKILKGEKPLALDMGFSICENFNVSMDYLYRGKTHDLPLSFGLALREYLEANQT